MTASAAARPIEAESPDAGDVAAAFFQVRSWLDAFDLPSLDEPEARVTIRNASGVCVILRHSGRVIGVGVDSSGNDLMLRRATGRALGAVLGAKGIQRLDVIGEDGARASRDDDELRRELESIGRHLTLEVEVAGPLVPMAGRRFDQIERQVEPGLHGVALRHRETTRLQFPSVARTTNSSRSVTPLLRGLAVDMELPAGNLAELLAGMDTALYRFSTVDLAEPRAGAMPGQLLRGNTVASTAPMTASDARGLVQLIGAHILQATLRQQVDGGMKTIGLMGNYEPATDRFDPMIAGPRDRALLACALGRLSTIEGIDAALASRAREMALETIRELAISGDANSSSSPSTSAAFVFAALAVPGALDQRTIANALDDIANRLDELFDDSRGFVRMSRDLTFEPVPPHAQALLTAAVCHLLANDRAATDADRAAAMVERTWSSVEPHRGVTLLPWIGWAELDLSAATGNEVRRPDLLRANLLALRSAQIVSSAVPLDLVGGYALTAGQTADSARADAQSLRPMAFIASALGAPGLIDAGDRPDALSRHVASLGFLRQMTVREDDLWAYRNPSMALGGVRAAPWDSSQPTAAQALAVLTLAETIPHLAD